MSEELKEAIIELYNITKYPDKSKIYIENTFRIKQLKNIISRYNLTPKNLWEINDQKLVNEFQYCNNCGNIIITNIDVCGNCQYIEDKERRNFAELREFG